MRRAHERGGDAAPRIAPYAGASPARVAEEEATLRARVRAERLSQLSESARLRKVAFVREGAQIRAEIAALRASLASVSQPAPPPRGGGGGGSPGGGGAPR